ncbi:MAG: NAAT family transporter [Gammaproteobacteria bacterium]|nr:NAAT family transporter [Gammaproteobacteria bacterium]NIR98872.1 NAAT family transporter [Gammaproteobacteria bacterium]NIT63993.1 NAAT family transporter [Gammaproteobacteria bacterium]NIV19153.1 NAAT family transporter [Gammaproteobacteria bacterium]NIX10322.1 NAAT family transporter [Gammaproteobacteria bacterium]
MDVLLNTFVVLFIVVDPIGVAWMFVTLTRGAGHATRRRMAVTGTALAAVILFVFFFIGDPLLRTLGITLPAFRIAGGVLLFLLAIDMVFARQSGLRSTTVQEQAEAEQRHDVSVFPLAFPLIAGPGALTTVLLMTSARGDPLIFLGMLAILALVLMLTLAALLAATAIMRLLGETGVNVLSRLLGLVLAALAVQYMLDGLRAGLLSG